MALKNLIDPATAGDALERWYAGRHPDRQAIRVSAIDIPQANGMSSETVMFDLTWNENGTEHTQPLVARVTPTSGGLYPTYDLAQDQQVIDAVAASTPVPVPATYDLEEDPSVLGSPFLIMERLAGRVPSDDPPYTAAGWVLDLTPGQQATLHDSALTAMAAIHGTALGTLPPETVGHPSRGAQTIPQQLAYFEGLYDWTRGTRTHPTIDSALHWIREHLPADEGPAGLSWGDARIGNMMFGDQLQVTGVLDWEQATIGEAELDLGWFLFLIRVYSEGMGLPPVPGFPSRDETIARYAELLDRPLQNLGFHEVFAAVRATIMMMRVGTVLIEAGALPPEADMPINNPASQLLARMLDLPVPSGEGAWITGNR